MLREKRMIKKEGEQALLKHQIWVHLEAEVTTKCPFFDVVVEEMI